MNIFLVHPVDLSLRSTGALCNCRFFPRNDCSNNVFSDHTRRKNAFTTAASSLHWNSTRPDSITRRVSKSATCYVKWPSKFSHAKSSCPLITWKWHVLHWWLKNYTDNDLNINDNIIDRGNRTVAINSIERWEWSPVCARSVCILIPSINKSPWLRSSIQSSIRDVRNVTGWYSHVGMRQQPDAIVSY